MSELEHTRRAPTLNTKEILDLARRERVVLKVEDSRLLLRGEPSTLLRAHLRSALVLRSARSWRAGTGVCGLRSDWLWLLLIRVD
jgi:hypothetical protein